MANHRVRRLPVLLVFLLWTVVPRSGSADTDIELLVDFSASMLNVSGLRTRLEGVQQQLPSVMSTIPKSHRSALRVFGHRSPAGDRAGSCKDSELLLPLGDWSKADWEGALKVSKARGLTPLAYSLEQLSGDFSTSGQNEKLVIVVTDGRDTCGGDPAAVVERLRAEGFKITFYVVGLDLDRSASEELRRITAAAHGKFVPVDGVATLGKRLHGILLINLGFTKGDLGTKRDAGSDFRNALEIKAGAKHQAYLSDLDLSDTFGWEVRFGEKYLINVASGCSLDGWALKVMDSSGAPVLDRVLAGNEDGSDVFAVTKSGHYFMQISANPLLGGFCDYNVELIRQSG